MFSRAAGTRIVQHVEQSPALVIVMLMSSQKPVGLPRVSPQLHPLRYRTGIGSNRLLEGKSLSADAGDAPAGAKQ